MSSLSVTALVIKQLENAAKDVSRQHINLLAEKYSFNAAEAIAFLDINAPLTLEEKKMARKAKAEGDDSSSSNKKKVIPLPWMGMVDPNCCQAITYNYGLFTQCPKKKAGTAYCAACEKSCAETATSEPPCGTVSKRIATADYVDSKGRKPTQYGKVLHKLKIAMADAIVFATEKGFTIPDCHLEEYVPPADSKGRPKKGDKEVTAGTEGLFDSLVENSSTTSGSTKGKKLSPEEKLARENKRKEEKEEKEKAAALKKGYENTAKALAAIGRDVQAIVAEGIPEEIALAVIDKYNEAQSKKAELAAKREAEKAEKKKLADEKKAAEKAEKEAKKAAEKEAKIELAKATAEAKKATKATNKPVQVSTSTDAKAVAQAVAQPQPQAQAQAVKVQRITITGEVVKKGVAGGDYLRDSNNVVYNADTREIIGSWSVEENKIVFNTSSDEEEEEYEEM